MNKRIYLIVSLDIKHSVVRSFISHILLGLARPSSHRQKKCLAGKCEDERLIITQVPRAAADGQ